MPEMKVEVQDLWTVVKTEHEGSLLFIRCRHFSEDFARTQFPQRINIFWQMQEPDPNGLPTTKESERLEIFENRLVAAVEYDDHSILSVVLTCAGRRELVFYTADVAGFMERLTNMPQEVERYPIDLQRDDDPEWGYFDAVRPEITQAR